MIKWKDKIEHGLGVIQKGLGMYNTIEGVYEVGKAVAPYVAAVIKKPR